jgi:hypothetical protein
MPAMLRQCAGDLHSYPVGITPEGWERRLEYMASTFDVGRRLFDSDCKYWERERLERRFWFGWALMGRRFFDLWD